MERIIEAIELYNKTYTQYEKECLKNNVQPKTFFQLLFC